jgi:hypothetical protein
VRFHHPHFRQILTETTLPRRYVSGALTGESRDQLRKAGIDVRTVPRAGHVMMTDNLDGLVEALFD